VAVAGQEVRGQRDDLGPGQAICPILVLVSGAHSRCGRSSAAAGLGDGRMGVKDRSRAGEAAAATSRVAVARAGRSATCPVSQTGLQHPRRTPG